MRCAHQPHATGHHRFGGHARPGTVDILLSADGGQTFPTTLATATPDDGAYEWDTSATTNGDYRIRIVATDFHGAVGAPSDLAGNVTVGN